MPQSKLHIVCFDVPYPANYGGAIDLFYKIKSLHEAGCEIYLHCYEYGRGKAMELEKYCREVHYYKRDTGISGVSMSAPYIVSSRKDRMLLKRLQDIDAPILFEGVHTTYHLAHLSLSARFKAVRTHNIEHEYYLQLANKETAIIKKTYFKIEAALLKKYEGALHHANSFLCLSVTDRDHFRKVYPKIQSHFIPPFHQYDHVTSAEGTGSYCLYHGNLAHPENREAALYLLREVAPHVTTSFIIAGKDPGAHIYAAATLVSNCKVIANPDISAMDELVRNAHIHVLPTFQQSGMKLKLLAALYGGRYVLVNDGMLHGTGLETACTIANNTQEFIDNISELMTQPFTVAAVQKRIADVAAYDKTKNALQVMQIMSLTQ